MTRRELWAVTTLMGICSLLLVSYALLRALQGGEVPDQALLEQLRQGGLLAGSVGIFGTIGWTREAMRPRG